MKRMKGAIQANLSAVKKGLGICSQWVTDASGENRKDCLNCPYQDPNDPAGMVCGERLMADAKWWIEKLEEKSE